jgi:glycerol dehydrogenase-like iron-containing ADH family enzyme
MTSIIGAPDRYVQGPGEISRLHEYGSRLGNEFLVVAASAVIAKASPRSLGAILAASVTGHPYQEEGNGHAGHEEEED